MDAILDLLPSYENIALSTAVALLASSAYIYRQFKAGRSRTTGLTPTTINSYYLRFSPKYVLQNIIALLSNDSQISRVTYIPGIGEVYVAGKEPLPHDWFHAHEAFSITRGYKGVSGVLAGHRIHPQLDNYDNIMWLVKALHFLSTNEAVDATHDIAAAEIAATLRQWGPRGMVDNILRTIERIFIQVNAAQFIRNINDTQKHSIVEDTYTAIHGDSAWARRNARARLTAALDVLAQQRAHENFHKSDFFDQLAMEAYRGATDKRERSARIVDTWLMVNEVFERNAAHAAHNLLYLLSAHKHWYYMVKQHVCESVQSNGYSQTVVSALTILDKAIIETLRLSQVSISFRRSNESTKFGEYGIPKDSFLIFNPMAMNFDPSIFPAPIVFNPSRYPDEEPTESSYDGASEQRAEAANSPKPNKKGKRGNKGVKNNASPLSSSGGATANAAQQSKVAPKPSLKKSEDERPLVGHAGALAYPSVWGSHRHMCPGRFYATLQVKLLVTVLMSMYDFGFHDRATDTPLDGPQAHQFIFVESKEAAFRMPRNPLQLWYQESEQL